MDKLKVRFSNYMENPSLMVVIFMVSLLVLSGCAGTIENQYKTYLTIDQEFTTLLEQYEIWYQAASIEQQSEWKASVDPLFIRADTILDQYRTVILAGEDPDSLIAQLKVIKTQLLMELAKRSE